MVRALMMVLVALGGTVSAGEVPQVAVKAAAHAVEHYDDAQVDLLAELVGFRTVHEEGVANVDNPEFQAFTDFLRQRAEVFGLDFTSLGPVLVIGLGDHDERLGIVTHGDVQPADPAKWRRSPFELDAESEPGRLIARGTEDDKAPIATALYAMKTLEELDLPLSRRIELIVSLTEESDWAPFLEVLETWTPPAMNIAIDSEYPVVVAEKGWGGLWVTFTPTEDRSSSAPAVTSFQGGAFVSQVPEDGRIEIAHADPALVQRLRERAASPADGVTFDIKETEGKLVIQAQGRAAHSMNPEKGRNALSHVAALLEGENTAVTAAGQAVDFVNALVGLGVYGGKFGDAAYEHPFMGPLTVNLSTARTTADGVELAINFRAPAGKTAEQLETEVRDAIEHWATERGWATPGIRANLNDAYYPERPPQVEPLLAVYRHYTGDTDAEPISIGGGTNARLLPNGINFGPSMPGHEYTGHSEHEFITREQMTLNLRMYTAMMTWLATANGER